MIGFKPIEDFTLKECEDFLRRDDISAEERQRAETRRDELKKSAQEAAEANRKTIMDEFPEYSFKPVTLLSDKGPKSVKTMGFVFIIMAIGLMVTSYCFNSSGTKHKKEAEQLALQYEETEEHSIWSDMHDEREMSRDDFRIANVTLTLGSILMFLAILFLISSKNSKRRIIFYNSVADYIPFSSQARTDTKYCVFVKNRKFGLLDRKKCEVTIPAQYDKLIYSLYLKNLLANNNGCWFMIDKQGERLSNDYDSLTLRNDQLLDAVRNGKHYVIDIYGNELS